MAPRSLQFNLDELPRSPRGFNVKATEQLLQEVATLYNAAMAETETLGERLRQLDGELARYRQHEQLVTNALLAAKQASEATREDARHDAELLLKKARVKAQKIVGGAERRHRELVEETKRLEEVAQSTRASLVAVLMETLERIERGTPEGDPESEASPKLTSLLGELASPST